MTIFNNDSKFDIDLQYGKLKEKEIADMLENSKIEVKTERGQWLNTGNIVIEHACYGKPSGISVTEADFWFHNLALPDGNFCSLVFPVSILKKYIKENTLRSVRGGDNNAAELYLVSLKDLFNIKKLQGLLT